MGIPQQLIMPKKNVRPENLPPFWKYFLEIPTLDALATFLQDQSDHFMSQSAYISFAEAEDVSTHAVRVSKAEIESGSLGNY